MAINELSGQFLFNPIFRRKQKLTKTVQNPLKII